MITLENLYSSDIKDILDWWNARKAGCIPAELSERVENAMQRLETDLHALEVGNTIRGVVESRFKEYVKKQKEIIKASQK